MKCFFLMLQSKKSKTISKVDENINKNNDLSIYDDR